MRPRLLDLFCGAGGASLGYARAGFDVLGVDHVAQPNYPFDFIQADALTFPLEGFAAVHASPPCQAYSTLGSSWNAGEYPDLYELTRERLQASGLPWVIENVIGAPYRSGVVLCGSMFELKVRRHRNFETSFAMLVPTCRHREQGQSLGVYGHGGGGDYGRGRKATRAEAPEAMGIDWMTHAELVQAVPPAMTEFIGAALLSHLEVAA